MKPTSQSNSNIRWWDPLAALLLVIMMVIASMRLVATQWTEDLSLVQTVTVLGVILGMAVGYSIFSRRVVFLLLLAYGSFIVPWQLGTIYSVEIAWPERLSSNLGRLEVVVGELIRRDPITDNILFLFLMAVLFWVLSAHAGYTLTRYANPWRMIIPTGLAIFVIHSFDPLLIRRSWYLAFYLFFSLLLLARLVYMNKREQWQKNRIHLPPDVGFDMSRFAVIVTVVLVLLAWTVPVLAESLEPAAELWQTANQPWLTLKDRFSFAFASLRASVGLVSDYYGNSLILGRGNVLSDRIVFEVETGRFPFVGARFYWRARTYDEYNTGQWLNNITNKREIDANSLDLAVPGADVRFSTQFKIKPHNAIATLLVVPQPLWVSRPADVYAEANPDGTVDVAAIQTDDVIRPGEQYEVRSSLTSITVADLRGAGTDYPDWVMDRYLALPDDITPRTRELAERIAQDQENPYDIADAITNYLRESIEYNDTIATPPTDQERVDWFLFDYRKGFCNYYATAEVVMLRSLGIPARIAVGYAQGERQVGIEEIIVEPEIGELPPDASLLEDVTFVVRQKDAHAWPEVFFPGFGWVEFEPTGNQEPLFRPIGESQNDESNADEETPEEQTQEFDQDINNLLAGLENQSGSSAGETSSPVKTAILSILLITALAVLVILIWQTRRGFKLNLFLADLSVQLPIKVESGLLRLGLKPPGFIRAWAYHAKLPSLGKSYIEINRALVRLGEPAAVNDTPAERADKLTTTLPSATEPTYLLLSEYQTETYSPHPADSEVARQAGSQIRRLSIIAKLQRLLRRFQEPPKEKLWHER